MPLAARWAAEAPLGVTLYCGPARATRCHPWSRPRRDVDHACRSFASAATTGPMVYLGDHWLSEAVGGFCLGWVFVELARCRWPLAGPPRPRSA